MGKGISSSFKKVFIKDLGKTLTGKTPKSENPEDFSKVACTLFVTPSDNFDSKHITCATRKLYDIGIEKLNDKLLPLNSIMVTC
ncbi:MAG: hypothetical protein ACJAQ0_001604, partial [Dasania sp.]